MLFAVVHQTRANSCLNPSSLCNMPQRLYLGSKLGRTFSVPSSANIFFHIGLSADATQADVQKLFENYGRLLECRVMTGNQIL